MRILQDTFPAILVIAPPGAPEPLESRKAPEGGGQLTIVRIVVSGDRVIVARDAGGGPQVVLSQPIQPGSHQKNPNGDSRVITETGQTLIWKKDTACGCGSRLRSWQPFKTTTNSVKDPTE
jgi:hypothetical protein